MHPRSYRSVMKDTTQLQMTQTTCRVPVSTQFKSLLQWRSTLVSVPLVNVQALTTTFLTNRTTFAMASTTASIQRFDTTPKYSEMVVHNGTIYLAGQVPAPDAESGDARAQTASCLASIDALLTRAGSDKTKILSAQVYITSMEHFAGMNEAWIEWMPLGHAPARATVANIALANSAWKVEIVVVAAQ